MNFILHSPQEHGNKKIDGGEGCTEDVYFFISKAVCFQVSNLWKPVSATETKIIISNIINYLKIMT